MVIGILSTIVGSAIFLFLLWLWKKLRHEHYQQDMQPIDKPYPKKVDRIGHEAFTEALAYLEQRQYQKALKPLKRALTRAKKPETELAVRARIAFILYKLGYFPDSLKEFKRSVFLTEKIGDSLTKAKIYLDIGLIYRTTGRTKEALDYFQRALALYRRIGNTHNRIDVQAEMAAVHLDMGDLATAHKLNIKSLRFHVIAGLPDGIGPGLANEARIFMRAKRPRIALLLYEAANGLARMRNDLKGLAIQMHNMGDCCVDLGRLELAERFHRDCLVVSQENEFVDLESATYLSLANIFLRKNELEDAFLHAQMSEQIFHKIGHKEGEGKSLGVLGEVARKRSNVEEAIRIHKKAFAIAESAKNLDTIKNLLLALREDIIQGGNLREFNLLAKGVLRKYPELKTQLPGEMVVEIDAEPFT